MKYWYFVAAGVAATMSQGAAAQADFYGPRIQALVGWDEISYDNDALNIDESLSGVTYGIATGYDFPLGDAAIVGIGTSAMLSDNKASRTIGDTTIKVKAKRDFEIAARVGAIIAESALLYGKIGYANAKVKGSTTTAGITSSDTTSGSGLRLGVGTEISFGGPVALIVEYRYTDYEKGFSRNQVVGGIGYRF